MKRIFQVVLACFIAIFGLVGHAQAGDTDPLYLNITTDDAHRALMGINFGKNQLERGHPLTIFLNDRGVFVGSSANAAKFRDQQKMLSELVAKGAVVMVCPMCMKHFGVAEGDLVPGLKVANPELNGAALFKDNTKTLTW